MAGTVGRPRHRARRLLGDRHGADRLLPVRPRPAGAAAARPPAGRARSCARGTALVGSVVGVGLLTLLVSGLPWTGFWGAKVQTFATEPRARRCGAPTRARLSDPTSTLDESLPHSHAQRRAVGAGRPRGAVARRRRGPTTRSVANVDTAIEVADAGGPAAPDDRGAAGRRRRRGVLGDRLRVRRAVGRADRPRRPVRRRGGVDVRLRRLPGAGQGGLARASACTRAAASGCGRSGARR